MSATDEQPGAGSTPLDTSAQTPYQQVQRSADFGALRRRWRGYIFLMSGLFLAWFLVYVLLADFAHGVVNTRLGDTNFTVGLLLGLLQFVSTAVIATLYARFADKNLDPDASRLRREVEERL